MNILETSIPVTSNLSRITPIATCLGSSYWFSTLTAPQQHLVKSLNEFVLNAAKGKQQDSTTIFINRVYLYDWLFEQISKYRHEFEQSYGVNFTLTITEIIEGDKFNSYSLSYSIDSDCFEIKFLLP